MNLPAVPTLPPPPPARFTDGSFTLYGVRHEALRNPTEMFSKQQRVHGFIVSVHVPRVAEGARQGQVCNERDRCSEERPHVYIADTRGERDPQRLMMVTGYATFQYEIDKAIRIARSGHPRRRRPSSRRASSKTCPRTSPRAPRWW